MAALEFRLPDVGEGIATAEIISWQVAEGDRVREHQDLVEIQTDKATVVIPCPADGVVARLCGEPGDTLDVAPCSPSSSRGRRRRRLGAGRRAATAERRAAQTPAPRRARRGAAPRGRPLAAPTTRRLARELGVALEEVAGSGAARAHPARGRPARRGRRRRRAASRRPAPRRARPPRARRRRPARSCRCAACAARSRTRSRAPGSRSRASSTTARSTRPRSCAPARACGSGRSTAATRRSAKALTPTPFVVRAAVLAAARPSLRQRVDRPRARGDHAARPLPRRHRDGRRPTA